MNNHEVVQTLNYEVVAMAHQQSRDKKAKTGNLNNPRSIRGKETLEAFEEKNESLTQLRSS